MNLKDLIDTSYLARYALLNAVDLSDHQVFAGRSIDNAPPVFHFSPAESDGRRSSVLGAIPSIDHDGRPSPEPMQKFLTRTGTVAFLVIHKDWLLVEHYQADRQRSSLCTSFSIAKSVTSALVGIALHEGLLQSLDDPITRYLPDLSEPHWQAISLRHLVSMSSGLKYNAHGFFPWDDEPRVYYSPNLRQLARQAAPSEPPGLRFRYNNYNLVLLGMILERVTGATVSQYLQEKIWKPLGMEFPASWSLDSFQSGMEKMESGLNARPIDFAKFGRLYLRGGDWDGRQVVPESWVRESTTVAPGAPWANYKYLWWIPRQGRGRYMAVGNLGQFIYVAPDKECLILRFGRAKPKDWARYYPQVFAAILELL
jgi:CubicO group peptidase (beta-lactamase class C family)